VNYNANASKFNDGNQTWTETNEYKQGDTVTVLGQKAAGAGLVIPTGYTFAGWCMDKAGNGERYGPRADLTSTFVIPAADVTLYAQFTGPSLTVKFVDWDGALLNTQTVGYGGAAIAPVDPVRAGYKFIGWDNAFDNVTGDLTVTAQYQSTFHVTYDANISAFNDGAATWVDPNVYYAGDTVTLLGNKTVGAGLVIPAGYNFSGWCMDKSGTGVKYGPGTAFTSTLNMPADDVTLYAQFTPQDQLLHVTYNANTSKFSNGDTTWVDPNVYSKGKTVTVLGNQSAGSGLIIPPGSSFAGWCMDKTGAGIKYGPRASFTSAFTMPGSDVTLYAQFTTPSFTVKFVDWNGAVLSAQSVEYGNAAAAPADPVREGYRMG